MENSSRNQEQDLLRGQGGNFAVDERAAGCKCPFINALQLQLTKIEQCATGSVYCAVMDCLYPNTFNFAKVKWGAKHEHEYIENYKILQSAFDKNAIKRFIEVGKLIKAKY